ELDLHSANITDAGLAHVKKLTNLRVLNLRGRNCTDTGMAHLAGLKSLRVLDLSRTEITDRGLNALKGLTQLIRLDPSETVIKGTKADWLKGLTKLRKLDLPGQAISDAVVKVLARNDKLHVLFQHSKDHYGDWRLVPANSATVRRLHLSSPRLTDDGLT